jgi:hypothetical protein
MILKLIYMLDKTTASTTLKPSDIKQLTLILSQTWRPREQWIFNAQLRTEATVVFLRLSDGLTYFLS